MSGKNEHVNILPMKKTNLRKCECCGKVQDIYFKALIHDFENKDILVGEFNLCKSCGQNFNKIIGNKEEIGTKVIKEFKFNK